MLGVAKGTICPTSNVSKHLQPTLISLDSYGKWLYPQLPRRGEPLHVAAGAVQRATVATVGVLTRPAVSHVVLSRPLYDLSRSGMVRMAPITWVIQASPMLIPLISVVCITS